MSAHRIVVTLAAGGDLTWKAECTAPEGATCRLVCPESCESWAVQHDDMGYFHMEEPFDSGDTVRHPLVDGGECGVCEWLNADPSLLPELYGGSQITLANLPIKPLWAGPDEGFEWAVAS